MKKILLLKTLVFCLISTLTFSQVVVNEISTNNSSGATAIDGSHPDWIEFYNPSSSPVNLEGYYLSDEIINQRKWTFPKFEVPAKGYATVYASGVSLSSSINHWESLVNEDMEWRYILPTSTVDLNWINVSFDDASWLKGIGGIGYGDGDDNTEIAENMSLYMRKKFTVVNKSDIASMSFFMDYDDGFVAYLNGVEIARANIAATRPTFDQVAIEAREAVMYEGGEATEFKLATSLIEAVLVQGENVLTVQTHNNIEGSSDMSSRPFLLAGIGSTAVNYTATPSWFDGSATIVEEVHTNFKLSSDGDNVLFLTPDDELLENVFVPAIKTDHSYARQTDGGSNWGVYTTPTYGTSNGGEFYQGYCNTLVFSVSEGFYATPQSLAISGESGANIRYEIDGREPTLSSPIYTAPIALDSTMVLRAQCMKAGYVTGKLYNKTYFINETTPLPIVSISTHPGNFLDPDTGIYVLGPNVLPTDDKPYWNANYHQDWERPIHIDFFDENKSEEFSIDCGVKIFGNWSRANEKKSLALYFRSEYGEGKLNYPVFPNYPGLKKFDNLLLRGSGNDVDKLMFRDAMITEMMSGTNVDYQKHRQSVVFMNGEYWGVHNIREKSNADYFETNYEMNSANIDLFGGYYNLRSGSSGSYENLMNRIRYDQASFTDIANEVDINSLIDYYAVEIYIVNYDWPSNNIKIWRDGSVPTKWRHFLYDTDYSSNIYSYKADSVQTTPTRNMMEHATSWDKSDPYWPRSDESTLMLRKLLEKPEFVDLFVTRYADFMNTRFHKDNMLALIDQYHAAIDQEIDRNNAKWGYERDLNDHSLQTVKDFFRVRAGYARENLDNHLNLGGQVDITIQVQPAGAGVIQVNTVTPGESPWSGVYFRNVPVTLTAIPNPGYTFDNWGATMSLSNNKLAEIEFSLNNNSTFTANFSGSAAPELLTISEINYNSDGASEAGDWFELHNYGNYPVDISGWVIKDEKDINSYTVPSNTVIASGAYLVFGNDLVSFAQIHPNVKNIKGPLAFGFGNGGDMIRLFDERGDLYLSMRYDDNNGWPVEADGDGMTLELIEMNADLNLPTSWMAGCLNGSPGMAYDPSDCVVLSQVSVPGQSMELSVYPNPTSGIINIELADFDFDKTSLFVYAVDGSEVFVNTELQENMRLDFSYLKEGVYFLKVIASGKVLTRSLVIE